MGVHLALVVHKLYHGSTWRLPLWQWCQIVLGFLIPLFLATHLFGTRIAHEVFDMDISYALVLLATWPGSNFTMAALIFVVWTHGCIGIHYWARLYPFYRHMRWGLYTVALLLPVLAYGGFVSAGREVAALKGADPFWVADMLRALGFPGQEAIVFVQQGSEAAKIALFVLVSGLLFARLARTIVARRGKITLTYPDQRKYLVAKGTTVLEASRQAGVPHASVCGGRGRCSTCRVRIGMGADTLIAASEAEQKVLRRIGAPEGGRLACQVHVTAPLTVTPLLPPSSTPAVVAGDGANRHGSERDVAVLFCDIREFTTFSEHRLPYDVVFVLNETSA
jgi:adenylate cyclase